MRLASRARRRPRVADNKHQTNDDKHYDKYSSSPYSSPHASVYLGPLVNNCDLLTLRSIWNWILRNKWLRHLVLLITLWIYHLLRWNLLIVVGRMSKVLLLLGLKLSCFFVANRWWPINFIIVILLIFQILLHF